MAFSVSTKRIYQGTLSNSDGLLFTATTLTMVRSIFVCNTTGASKTYRLHLCKGAGASSATNAICYDQALAANVTDHHDIMQVLSSGDTIRGLASATTSVGINISGIEVTGTDPVVYPMNPAQSLLPASSTLLWTVTTNRKAILKDIIVCNSHATLARTFRLDVVKFGQSVGTSTQLYNAESVAALSQFHAKVTVCMDSGDMVYAQASAASSLAMTLTGVEFA